MAVGVLPGQHRAADGGVHPRLGRAAPAEQGALPAADEVAAALDTPAQVHGRQLSLAEYIERLEEQRNAAPPID